MLRKFASLGYPEKYGYAYDTEAWGKSGSAPIHSYFRMFETYGDGLCQHSGDWGVGTEYIMDFWFSLAAFILAHPEDTELVGDIGYHFTQKPRLDQIEFCATVKWTPKDEENRYGEKRRYFSVSEMKFGTRKTKEYDKRYQEIEKDHDGQPGMIYRLLIPEYARGMEQFCYAQAIWDWQKERQGIYMDMPAIFLKWTEDRDTARYIRDAFDSVRALVEAYHRNQSAQCDVDNYNRRLERQREKAQAPPAETAA